MKAQNHAKRQPWQWALTVLAFLIAVMVIFGNARLMPLVALAFVALLITILWWAYKRTDGYKHF